MECDFCTSPRLVQRRSGGWLAHSGRDESLKVGVIAATAAEAEDRYRQAVIGWKHIIASTATKASRHGIEEV